MNPSRDREGAEKQTEIETEIEIERKQEKPPFADAHGSGFLRATGRSSDREVYTGEQSHP
jgi:hypothetical protein